MSVKKDSQLDLTKLAPRKVRVELSGGYVLVSGLQLGDIAALFLKFPSFARAMNGTGDTINLTQIAADAPEAVPHIIAAGTGQGAKAVAGIKSLPPEEQLRLFAAVVENTFPGGVAGFFVEVIRLAKRAIGSETDLHKVLAEHIGPSD